MSIDSSSAMAGERARANQATAHSGTPLQSAKDANSDDSRLKRLSDTAGHVRSIITTAVVAVGLSVIVALALWDSLRNVVVLDAIEVPDVLAERGYTSAVATRQLADAIRDIQRESKKLELQKSGREINIGSVLADVQVPGGVMSIGTMVRYVRQVLRLPETRLSGEITFDDKELELGKTPLRLVVRGSGEFGFSRSWTSPLLSELMAAGAIEIVKNIDPYVAAIYYSVSNTTLSSDIILRLCLTRPPADDDPWALVLLGNIHRSQGRYGLAIEQFKRAVESASDPRNVAEAQISWAATLRDRGHYSEALDRLRLAEASNPDDINLNAFWAYILEHLGQPRAANKRREMVIANSRKAIKEQSSNAFAYGNLAWALDGLRRGPNIDKEAQRFLQQAAEFDSATAHYYRGVLWQDRGELERAVEEYRKALLNRPQDASSNHTLAFALQMLADEKVEGDFPNYAAWNRRYDQAISKLKRALELDPAHVLALIQLGYIYEVLGKHLQAAEQYDEALKILDDDGDDEGRALVYVTWGLAFLKAREFGEAVEKFALAAKADSKNAESRYLWGLALENIDPFNPEKTQVATVRYRIAIDIEPAFAELHILLGDTFVRLGQPYEATEQYRKAADIDLGADVYAKWGIALAYIANDPNSTEKYSLASSELAKAAQLHRSDPDARARFADAYSIWGDLLEEWGQHSAAIEKYRNAIELNPEKNDAYQAWGRALGALAALGDETHQSELQMAAAKLDAYATDEAISSRMAWTYHSWGALLEKQNDHNGAIAKYKKTIEFDTKFTDAYSGWGIALGGLAISSPKQYEEEVALLKTSLPSDPTERKAFARVYNGIGNALEDARRHDDAIAKFEEAISLDPDYVDAHAGLARAFYLVGIDESNPGKQAELYHKATRKFKDALDVNPIESRTYESWGQMLYKSGSYKDAVAKLAKAVEFDPNNADAHAWCGRVYLKLGKVQEAIEQYRKAIALGYADSESLEDEIELLQAEELVTGAGPSP